MSDIHDLFHDNDTADPTTNGWAEEVRARHRRNRVLTGVAAGVLAVGNPARVLRSIADA